MPEPAMTELDRLVTWAAILLLGAAAGVFFNVVVMPGGRPILGAIFGLFTGVPMLAFMQGMLLTGLQQRLRRLPFPLYAQASLAIYVLMIMMSSGFAGGLLWGLGAMRRSFLEAVIVPREGIIYP